MENHELVVLASIGVISLICQWIAWRIRLPAILLLLLSGILMGPVTGWLDPDTLFKNLLFPIVSLSVAIILFEGSLTLKRSEIKEHGHVVRNLLTIGTCITWVIASLACRFTTGLPWDIAILFGAIVVVTGPTVIMPLLRSVRPTKNLSNILKWEGIIVDPIGALLAVLVFEFVISDAKGHALGNTFISFGTTLLTGIILGGVTGFLLGQLLKRHLLPQFLQNAGTLTSMLGVYALSNYFSHESGLLTVTIMGMMMTNMRDVPVDDILEFKESLSVLLISGLFIILAARIEFSSIVALGWGPLWVLLALMLIARPLAVWGSTYNSNLRFQEKLFLSWIAPRGIVAAAVSALFSFQLIKFGHPEAEKLVPLVFLVIITTVILQSLTASPLARFLKVEQPANNGFLFIGSNIVAREIAKSLMNKNIPVLLTDTNWENIRLARMANLPVYFGNPVSEHAENYMDITGIGNMLATSPYKELNTQATFHFLDLFGNGHVFGLSEGDQEQRASHQASPKFQNTRNLFGNNITFAKLASLISKGATLRITQLSDNFTLDNYRNQHGNRLTILFTISPSGVVTPKVGDQTLKAPVGTEIISLIQPEPNNEETAKPE
jgi:NhaP-type Na+/H+ or K+/H+ antiporter